MLKIDNRIWLTTAERERLVEMTGHTEKITTFEEFQAVLNHAADRLAANQQHSECGRFDLSGAAEIRLWAEFADLM